MACDNNQLKVNLIDRSPYFKTSKEKPEGHTKMYLKIYVPFEAWLGSLIVTLVLVYISSKVNRL